MINNFDSNLASVVSLSAVSLSPAPFDFSAFDIETGGPWRLERSAYRVVASKFGSVDVPTSRASARKVGTGSARVYFRAPDILHRCHRVGALSGENLRAERAIYRADPRERLSLTGERKNLSDDAIRETANPTPEHPSTLSPVPPPRTPFYTRLYLTVQCLHAVCLSVSPRKSRIYAHDVTRRYCYFATDT